MVIATGFYNERSTSTHNGERFMGAGMPWFGETLRKLRERAGMTRAELAARVGASASSIESWEQGRRQPGLDSFFALVAALGVKPEELMKDPGKTPKRKPGRPSK